MIIKNKILISIFILFCNSANSQVHNILEYGAIADTSFISTNAVQSAIDSCYRSGGGQVLVPAGKFKIGTIVLKSNVRLFLESGAFLYGSTNLNDYKQIKTNFISLRTQDSIIQLIYAENCVNIAIGGYGEIDGQGAAFKAKEKDEGITRPFLIRLIRCSNVKVENLSLKNSACWMQHYLACEKINIRGLRIFNRVNLNNDAMDIDGCKDVVIADIISDTEDDGITLKSTSGWVTENVVITNCILSSRWNAIKMGTESSGGFKNIAISNCVLKPTKIFPWHDGITSAPLTGLTLIITDGGILENVVVSNIAMDGFKAPIYIRLANRARSYLRGMPVTSVGKVHDISIDNVQITNAGQNGCSITGIPGHPIENIRLRNITIQFSGGGSEKDAKSIVPDDETGYPQADIWTSLPAFGFYIAHAKNVSFNGVELRTQNSDARPAFFFKDVEQVSVTNSKMQSHESSMANIVIDNSDDVFVQGNSIIGKSKCFLKLQGDKAKNIVIINNNLKGVKQIFTNLPRSQQNVIENSNVQ